MITFFIFIFCSAALSLLILSMIFFISKKGNLSKEKFSPFECGFNPKELSRMRFSIQFFLVALIFLVFDLELVILFPFIYNLPGVWGTQAYFSCFLFLLLVTVGLIHEWNQKSLEWKDSLIEFF